MALFRFNDKTIQKYYYRKFYPFKLEIVTTGVTSLTLITYSALTFSNLVNIPNLYYDYELDFGDGTEPIMINSYNHTGLTHTYTSSTGGTYTLKIHGLCESLRISSNTLTKVLDWGYSGLKYLSFQNCSNFDTFPLIDRYKGLSDILTFSSSFMNTKISTIPEKLFWNSRKLRHYAFPNTFNGCVNITSIPENLFKYNVNLELSSFVQTFIGTKISTIPNNLFRYNTKVTDSGINISFNGTFANCTLLQTIPSDLFRYNTKIKTLQGVFYNTSIYSLPVDLFRYNTEITSFDNTFYGMNYLTELPVDLFRYNTKVTSFNSTFLQCEYLQTVPDYLFKYNVNATNFYRTFYNCYRLKINQWLFSDSGETGTRFLNKNMNFSQCFYRLSWLGNQIGYAQLIYYNYGTGTLTLSGCYGGTGNNSSSISNYGSIPAGWK